MFFDKFQRHNSFVHNQPGCAYGDVRLAEAWVAKVLKNNLLNKVLLNSRHVLPSCAPHCSDAAPYWQ